MIVGFSMLLNEWVWKDLYYHYWYLWFHAYSFFLTDIDWPSLLNKKLNLMNLEHMNMINSCEWIVPEHEVLRVLRKTMLTIKKLKIAQKKETKQDLM